jgi:hypothetical protein
MKLTIKKVGLNNHTLKIFSLIFGYLFWIILVQNQKINTTTDVPLCFYGLNENLEIIAPENIQIKILAKRIDLANIDHSQIAAIHVDANKYNIVGEYKIKLNDTDIFLHNKIKLIDYFPSEISIKVKEKK